MSTSLTPEPYSYTPGSVPVLLSIPHCATYVPTPILKRLTEAARKLPDTDWHVERLYDFARELGAHVLTATHSRFVVDLNRAPDNESLYPGKFTTGICPVSLFDGNPVYVPGAEPDADEVTDRVATCWQPYHLKLQAVIEELKEQSKRVVVFDAHSIRSQVPLLFEGTLPDLNFGTADGASVDKTLQDSLMEGAKQSAYSTVCNGRFKGGYITRHYGNPASGVHAIQLELAQHNYMQEDYPFAYDEEKAAKLKAVLKDALSRAVQWVSA